MANSLFFVIKIALKSIWNHSNVRIVIMNCLLLTRSSFNLLLFAANAMSCSVLELCVDPISFFCLLFLFTVYNIDLWGPVLAAIIWLNWTHIKGGLLSVAGDEPTKSCRLHDEEIFYQQQKHTQARIRCTNVVRIGVLPFPRIHILVNIFYLLIQFHSGAILDKSSITGIQ